MNHNLDRCGLTGDLRLFISKLRQGCCLAWLGCMFASLACAQTLDKEYDRLLGNKCAAMGFARDNAGQLLPGQAAGSLQGFCSGTPAPSDPSVNFLFSDWSDRIYSIGPHVIERTTTMPGWRDRTVRHNQPRRAARRGEEPKLSASNGGAYLALRPGFSSVKTDYESTEVVNGNFAVVLGGNYWFTDALLISGAGAVREQGFDAGVSLAWAPTERGFVETMINYDRSEQRFTRNAMNGERTSYGSYRVPYGTEWVSAAPRIELFSMEVYGGYDWQWGRRLLIGPRIGTEFRSADQSKYSERVREEYNGSIPTALAFDAATENSLRHHIGIGLSLAGTKGRMTPPQLEFSWLHEYLDPRRTVTAHFTDDLRATPTQLSFQSSARSRDVFAGRLGWGFRLAPRFAVFATGEVRYDDNYGYEVNGIIGVRAKL